MATDLHLLQSNILGNGFIANVNLLAKNLETLSNLLTLPAELNQVKIDVTSIKNKINDVFSNIKNIESNVINKDSEVQNFYNRCNAVLALVRDVASELENSSNNITNEQKAILSDTKKYAQTALNCLADIDASKRLGTFVDNVNVTYVTENKVNSNSIVNIPGLSYYVGRDVIHVSWEGVELYKGIHYEEVGEIDNISHSIKFIQEIPKDNTIAVWVVASNIIPELDKVREEVQDALNKIEEFCELFPLITGITNQEVTVRITDAIHVNDVFHIPNDFVYGYDRKTLRVSWEGVELYKGIHYQEVRDEVSPRANSELGNYINDLSSSVKFLIEVPANNTLNFWNISSNEATGIVLDALNKITVMSDRVTDNLIEATEQADRADKAAEDTKALYDKLARINCCIPFMSLEDPTHTQIPNRDCIFIYTVDAGCPDLPNTPEVIPPTELPVSICGKRAALKL